MMKQALRVLAKNPGFSILSILTLAMGIGANTAIFSVVHSVLLLALPYPDADRIVAMNTLSEKTGRVTRRLTGGDLLDLRGEPAVFEAISSYNGGEMGVQVADRAEFTGVFLVNPEFFRVLGVQALAGRPFTENEPDGAVVGVGFAERHFGNPAAALGKTFRFENKAYSIVGVMPKSFQFPRKAEVWTYAPVKPQNLNRTAYNYPTVARLRAGVSVESAQAQLDTVSARLASAYPASNTNKKLLATPLREQLVGSVRSTLVLLMGAVALVLLIACSNVANLLLARATGRAREMAVRAAMGASRWQLVRQLLAESAVLGVLGGALGLLLAYAAMGLLVRMAPENLPRMNEVQLDPTVLAFTIGISLLASIFFGLIPAWQASRVDLNRSLKEGGGRGMVGGRSNRMRNALVIAEIALSFVLAMGAGLLLRSFLALSNAELGYRTEGILVMYAHLPARTDPELVQATHSFEDLFKEIGTLPGVTSVAAAMGLPTGQYGSNGMYAVEGKHTFAPGQVLPQAGFRLTSPGYFATMGVPLLRGRDFNERDQIDAPFTAIVSQALVKQVFPNEDPIGRRIQCGLDSMNFMTIVGVVGDVRQDSPASAPAPELYMPFQQHPSHGNELQVVMRTAVDPGALISAVREKVRQKNASIATKFTTMDAMVSESVAAPRFRTFLVGTFAGLALLLAMAGVYGVMAYLVTQRTSELGLRMALGASPVDVLRLVLGRAATLAAVGLSAGLAMALGFSRVLKSLLFGLEATDVSTYARVMLAVGMVTLLAALLPAWRASRIDPVVALRDE